MALRSGYKGFKKLLPGLKIIRPGTLGIDNAELSKTFFTRSEQAASGVANFLPRYHGTDTVNGVTFTVGSDEVVTLSNEATGYADFPYTKRADKVFRLPVGTWKVIPRKTGTDESYINIGSGNTTDGTGGSFETWASSTGNIVTFTVDETRSARYISVSIAIAQGKTANSTWQPMIVPADYPDNMDYVPYAMTNRELTPAILKATTDFTFDTNGNLITKQGNIAVPYLRVTGVTATANDLDTPVCVVPEECRSQMTKIFPVISSGQVIMATLYTNGKIVVNTSVTSATITIMIPWSILP